MLLQLIEIGQESAWDSLEDRETWIGRTFYIKDPKDWIHLDRKWEDKPNTQGVVSCQLVTFEGLNPRIIPDNFGFFDCKFRKLRL